MSHEYVSRRRIFLRWTSAILVVGVAAIGGRLIHVQIKARAARGHAPVPYTVILREMLHDSDGSVRPGPESIWAIRSDGSRAIRLVEKHTQRILNFSSGLEVIINEATNTKTSMIRP